jgi:hypothetical protein
VDIAALVAWIVTVLGGLTLAALWGRRGGASQPQDESEGRGKPGIAIPVLVPHALLAIAGLVIWAVYITRDDSRGMSYTPGFAVGALAIVIVLGLVMFRRWSLARRDRDVGGEAERRLPVALVTLHGLAAATTFALVVVTLFD